MLEILTLGANHLTLILEHMTCCMQMVSSLLKKRGMNFALSHFRLFFLWMQTSFYTQYILTFHQMLYVSGKDVISQPSCLRWIGC